MAVVYEGLVSRHLNRRFSRPVARLLTHTPVTPNQVSVASLAIAFGSFLSFAYGLNIVGGVLAQVSSVVDGVDGDLARRKNAASAFGGFLDAVLDRYADALVLLGVIVWTANVWIANDRSGDTVWVVGFWALVGTFVISYTRARVEGGSQARFDRGVTSLATRDVRLLIVMVGSILGQGLPTLIVIAALTHTVVVLRLLHTRRSLREPASPAEGVTQSAH